MKNLILPFIVVSCILCGETVSAQKINDDVYADGKMQAIALSKNNGKSIESKIENTQLQLDGENLIITYDVIGSANLDNVWLEIKTVKGVEIKPRTVSGDIGKNISTGKRKRIIWNMKTDSVDLQGEELDVRVLATKLNLAASTLCKIKSGYSNKRYFAMPFVQIGYGIGLRLGVIDSWGYYAQISKSSDCGNVGIGVSKHIYSVQNMDIHVAAGISYGSYSKAVASFYDYNNHYHAGYNNISESSGTDIGLVGRYRNIIVNVGVGIPFSYGSPLFTIGVGYSLHLK